jgi:hypothetical protein
MATTYSGSITYLRNGQRVRIMLPKAPTFAAVQQFAAAVYPYTTAGICQISFTQSTDPELFEKSGDVENAEFMLRVKLRLRNPPPTATATIAMLDIPAPDSSYFDHITERGYRLQRPAGEAIAAAYSTFTGQTYTFEEGWLCN